MMRFSRRLLFALFFISGFCGLLYQVIWTRMAFAAFGIITPVMSVVISIFMAGLSLGSWAGGRFVDRLVRKTGRSPAIFYAAAEVVIGLGAFVVPRLFLMGERWLLTAGQADSARYLGLSAVVLGLSILPWCVAMGTTFPFMMAYVREQDTESSRSFSFLYLANVIGAMTGTLITAVVLVELLGFKHTLWVASAGNFTVALVAASLGKTRGTANASSATAARQWRSSAIPARPLTGSRFIPWILFSTGFSAMAMEVVWTREFTPVLKTQVYSFAMVLFTYLGATFAGSYLYRRDLARNRVRTSAVLLLFLPAAAFLPLLANDPRYIRMDWGPEMFFTSIVIVLASICPFCGILGYLTPRLIDEYSDGNPAWAGRAYAINVVGCILGPLFASYILLPRINERDSLLILGFPFLVFCILCFNSARPRWRIGSAIAGVAVLLVALFFSATYEGQFIKTGKHTQVRRDYAASVISVGEGGDKLILVNGVTMTSLSPVTKFMAHLPLAFHDGPSTRALIICFGMGTSYRSCMNWGIDTTAVELVPSVRDAFGFYHVDAAWYINTDRGRVIVDDGRRFLCRTGEMFDIIVIDPPPPVEAAGSSLLYSEEFYGLAKQHLKPHGILQAWYPAGENFTGVAALRSLKNSFPHVRCFSGLGEWGTHMFASMEPINIPSAETLVERMPARARRDLLEWSDTPDLAAYIKEVVTDEINVQNVLDLYPDPELRITDDRPYNEYFILRRSNLISP